MCHSCVSRNPGCLVSAPVSLLGKRERRDTFWIPAFAGMTPLSQLRFALEPSSHAVGETNYFIRLKCYKNHSIAPTTRLKVLAEGANRPTRPSSSRRRAVGFSSVSESCRRTAGRQPQPTFQKHHGNLCFLSDGIQTWGCLWRLVYLGSLLRGCPKIPFSPIRAVPA